MNSNMLRYVFLLCAALSLGRLTRAQETEKATEAALKQASDAAKKMGVEMPDVQKIMEDNDKEEAQEKAKAKAKAETAINAPGPAAFPAWMPAIPQFTPAGPVAKKVIEDKAQIIQTGTSPLTPAALADAWEKTEHDKYMLSRTNANINDTVTHTITFRQSDEPNEEVTMEAKRAPGEKITHVTITSPLPVAKSAADD